MSAPLFQIRSRESAWVPLHDTIVIGKDILELLSSSMYVDPLTIYREYVQNAADAIDEARATATLGPDDPGRIEIQLAIDERTVRVRDNGAGIPEKEFDQRLTSFGASKKRGTSARGFRGVGRLAGIGSCQELIFRSRAEGQRRISELRWDCKALKGLLRSTDNVRDLSGTVSEVVTVRTIDDATYPSHFFEVELRGVIRQRNDQLLNPTAINDYLSQVAPVPFSPEFCHAAEIGKHLAEHVQLGNLQITVTGLQKPITRPHGAGIPLVGGEFDPFREMDLITVPGVDGGVAAVGWIVHHGYTGALPASCGVRGLRLRVGNIQVGDERLLEEIFPESRFNGWSVGEIHVLDSRVTPNGRRDHFEQNTHYQNLLTHLSPAAREIARRCRTSSLHRKWERDFDLAEKAIKEKVSIIRQGATTKATCKQLVNEIRLTFKSLEQIANRPALPTDLRVLFQRRLEQLNRSITKLAGVDRELPSHALTPRQRRVIDLIFECSPNQAAAKLLVDKIVQRLDLETA